MKTESASYIEKDEKETRLPIELYHIWDVNGTHWRYTSYDATIEYEGESFLPATIERSAIEYDEGIDTTRFDLKVSQVNQPVIRFLSTNPIDTLWIQVLKIFADQSPYSASNLFTGIIKNVSFQGLEANANCTGFEHFLKRHIPKGRYSPGCGYFLYDSECTIDKTLYQVDTTLTGVDDTETILTSADFALQDDDYYTFGYIEFGNLKRMIISHTGENVTMRYPISGIIIGDNVSVFTGCNKRITTCRDKFDNVINFGGHPNIPVDNPAVW